MIYPKFINKNSVIGIAAPSDGADSIVKINRYKNAYKRLKKLGFNVFLSDNLFNSEEGRSADAKKRAQEVNDMFLNDTDLIMCASGGEFLVEILPFVDFNLLKENPKFVAGFSDPTALLYPITTKLDIASIYGKNFSNFGSEKLHESEDAFLKLITGDILEQESYPLYEDEYIKKITGLESYNLGKEVKWQVLDNKNVCVSGRVIGGCMDIISVLSGTKYDGGVDFCERYKDDGIIWYFDNCELSCEEVIRVLWKFNELGYFKYAKAIIFGRFGSVSSMFGYDERSCLSKSVLSNLNIPIIFGADFSHKGPCLNVINGAIINIRIQNFKGIISFDLK